MFVRKKNVAQLPISDLGPFNMFGAAHRDNIGISGSTDSTLTDVTLTSAINSPGNTSNSSFSIPWAEDAIRQNKEFWERIERMLYGEEDLPSDETTRNEILEWRVFPQLRVKGNSSKFHYTSSNLFKPTDPGYEEIIAQHPNSHQVETESAPVLKRRDIGLDLEDCLKISSGPVARRSAIVIRKSDNQFPPIKPLIEKVKTIEVDSSGRVTRNNVVYRHMTPTHSLRLSSRMAPEVGFLIRNSGGALNVSKVLKAPSSKSASYRLPQQTERRRVILPSINVTPPSFDSGIVGRSISATAVHSRKHSKRRDFKLLPDLSSDDSP